MVDELQTIVSWLRKVYTTLFVHMKIYINLYSQDTDWKQRWFTEVMILFRDNPLIAIFTIISYSIFNRSTKDTNIFTYGNRSYLMMKIGQC